MIDPLRSGIIHAAVEKFIIVIRISTLLPKTQQSADSPACQTLFEMQISAAEFPPTFTMFQRNVWLSYVKGGDCGAHKSEVMLTAEGVCGPIFIVSTKYNRFTACLLIFLSFM